MKKVIISVSNDLVTDQRADRLASALSAAGYNVTLIGRKRSNSILINRSYKTKRFRLIFNRGPLFYACLNCRIFFYILFNRYHILLACDLDTLPGNYWAAKLKGIKLVYDSHEYFTEVPELIGRDGTRKIWLRIERRILPGLKYSSTVCDSIADEYYKKYGVKMVVIRNVPPLWDLPEPDEDDRNKRIIIYQGAMNLSRGIENMIDAITYLPGYTLWLAGDGDITNDLKQRVAEKKLEKQVVFLGRVPFEKLHEYTCKASLGLSLEQNAGLNYYYSLPNKIFDYIHAGIPVLASAFPEIEKIINRYDIGLTISRHDPEYIAECISNMVNDTALREKWRRNALIARGELNWETEKGKLLELFAGIN
ncbi:MAG: glycosyltransferase [Bacteroidota bacterium]